ncbi:MAG: MFS transporter [Thermoguttaceae bacterium]|nr:MFS transporter [Thermoguttaceae bacterium]
MTNASRSTSAESAAVVPGSVFLPFCLVTTLFAFWGFANDVTNPLVRAFQEIFLISSAQSSLVQTAFYGGYATMAIPAALFIRRYSYKAGILVGLGLYAAGALLFIPASITAVFWLFLVALYILTFGLAFLETTANPYVLAMGPPATATRRLNFAQAFNPIGSLTGMVVASQFVLASLGVQEFRDVQTKQIQARHRAEYEANRTRYQADREGYTAELKTLAAGLDSLKRDLANLERDTPQFDDVQRQYQDGLARLRDMQMAVDGTYQPMLPGRINAEVMAALKQYRNGEIDFAAPAENADGDESLEQRFDSHQAMVAHDLRVIRMPYIAIGMVIIGAFVVFAAARLPKAGGEDRHVHFLETVRNLAGNGRYLGGVIAQTFYVGAQIMCWTFIIHYAMINLNMSLSQAQRYNTVAMVIFCSSRFVCTYLLKYVSPGGLLAVLAAGGIALTLGAILAPGMAGLYCLIGISACMSLMFPTIYGIALAGLGEDAKLGSAGLIFAIVGGAFMPPLQGRIIDLGDSVTGALDLGFTAMPAVSVSFVLPLVCFVVIALYGLATYHSQLD